MPHFIDEYAPGTGVWQAPSGRRYNLILVDPQEEKLPAGRPHAVADNEEKAAAFFNFIPAREPVPRRPKERSTPKQPEVLPTERSLNALLENYLRVESLNIGPTAAVQLARWANAGNKKAQEVEKWVAAHWAEYRVKQAAIARGESIPLKPSSPWKPYRFEEIASEVELM
jgi:hypothetical protein